MEDLDIRKSIQEGCKILQNIPGRTCRVNISEELADITETFSYPPQYKSSVSIIEEIRDGQVGVIKETVEEQEDGKKFGILDWGKSYKLTGAKLDHKIVAFIDGIQRTIPAKELLAKNGAIGLMHLAVVTVGTMVRVRKSLKVKDDLIVQKTLILGPIKGLLETGIIGNDSYLHLLSEKAILVEQLEKIKDMEDHLLVIDTTDPHPSEITKRRDQTEEGKQRLYLKGEGLLDLAAQRRRARNRVGRIRQILEYKTLKKASELPKENEWIVLDGTTVDLSGEDPEKVFRRLMAVSKTLRTRFLSSSQTIKVIHMKEKQRCSAFQFIEDYEEGAQPNVRMKPRISWYMRLHGYSPSGPLPEYMGLVRIELHEGMIRQNWVNLDITELADTLSYLVFRDRLPVPMDDPRWASLLYPVQCVERLLRARIPSIDSILAMVGQ